MNNVLTVLNVLLKKAAEWGVIERMPCTIRLLKVPRSEAGFLDFDQYERLVVGAQASGATTLLVVLLAGDAGLRCGEIMALHWTDVDLATRQLCILRLDWQGHVTVPKGGRLRRVPMTVRLAAALRDHRYLREPLVVCQRDSKPLTQKITQDHVRWAATIVRIKGAVVDRSAMIGLSPPSHR